MIEFRYDIYISYSHENSVEARMLRSRLGSAGLRIWIDMDALVLGQSWIETVKDAIDSSFIALVLIGQNGISDTQRHEISQINASRVINLLFKNSDSKADVSSLSSMQTLNVAGINADEQISIICRHIVCKLLKIAPSIGLESCKLP